MYHQPCRHKATYRMYKSPPITDEDHKNILAGIFDPDSRTLVGVDLKYNELDDDQKVWALNKQRTLNIECDCEIIMEKRSKIHPRLKTNEITILEQLKLIQEATEGVMFRSPFISDSISNKLYARLDHLKLALVVELTNELKDLVDKE